VLIKNRKGRTFWDPLPFCAICLNKTFDVLLQFAATHKYKCLANCNLRGVKTPKLFLLIDSRRESGNLLKTFKQLKRNNNWQLQFSWKLSTSFWVKSAKNLTDYSPSIVSSTTKHQIRGREGCD
jgi:hypothetical protein